MTLTEVIVAGWDHERTGIFVRRFERALNAWMPNPMEAALRSVAWLEIARFRMSDPAFSLEAKTELAMWLLRAGAFIERRLHEIPLGGNHLLTHAAGLLYIGRLLPGLAETNRWAERGERILNTQVLRQFHKDGGTYEQSTAYHLFTLDVVLGCALLLRGQGATLPEPIAERVRAASRFAAAITRPDGSIPLLGDDDSGRFHRWGNEPPAREICSLAALLLDDTELAVAAAGSSEAATWLMGGNAPSQLQTLATRQLHPLTGQSFARTGLHVLRAPEWHAVVWARDPRPPAMLAHAHSDQNSLDLWCSGNHVLRDPGTGVYVGDPALRNQLRATGAHSTLTVDGVEVNRFQPDDLFFMPPSTRGRRVQRSGSDHHQSVTTTHDGFRRIRGNPSHVRSVELDAKADALMVWDQVFANEVGPLGHRVRGWWHWGAEPSDVSREETDRVARWRFRVSAIEVDLYLPIGAEFVISEPHPWSPRYGVVRAGRRSVVTYHGPLPFRMALRIRRGR